jgi:hypothetical protein
MFRVVFSSLMMEAVRTSETSVDNHFTRHYIPEDNSEHHTRRREKLKSHKDKLRQCFPDCGPRRFARWSSAVCRRFRKESHCKNCIKHWRNVNAPIHVCAKTAFVGWPSTQNRRISSSYKFLSYSHVSQFIEKNVVMVTLSSVITCLL